MTTRAPRHRTFHVHDDWYYTEDSLRGIETAAAKGYPWIDLDCQVTADGVLVVAHGPRPLSWRLTGGFEDPGSERYHWLMGDKVKRTDTFADLTWAQVSRLRSRRPGPDGERYRISRADVLVPKALKAGLKVELEVKSGAITREQLAALRVRAGNAVAAPWSATSQILQVKGFPRFLPALHAASRAGYTTIALTHPGQRHLPTSAKAWLDYFRGRSPIWDQGR